MNKKKLASDFKRLNKKTQYLIILVALVLVVIFLIYIATGEKLNGANESNGTSQTEYNSESVSSVSELNDLKITFIDVGQGDAIFINFPDGKNMLIDAGDDKKFVENALDKYLTKDGVKYKLDYCLSTHSDSDHIGSMDYVYQNYEIDYSFRPYTKSTHENASSFEDEFNLVGLDMSLTKSASKVYYNYLNELLGENTDYEFFFNESDFENRFSVGDTTYSYKIDFMMPYASNYEDYAIFKDVNDLSAVCMLEYAGRKVLFTGDIGYASNGKSEKAFVDSYTGTRDLVDCDVLKVAHHGSGNSSYDNFLDLVKPEYTVISCGLNNHYEHPNQEALDRILSSQQRIMAENENAECKMYRTDLNGTVTLTISSSGEMTFTTQTDKYNEYLWVGGETLDYTLIDKSQL